MKTKTKFILLGILSLLVGSAFATPLLITELEIMPFYTMPKGPQADLSASLVYANFTIQNGLPKYDNDIGDYNKIHLDYYIILNVTNLSEIPTKLSNIYLAGVKNTTITPSAIGGFHVTNRDSEGHSGRSGPVDGYLGHVGGGRVEGLWFDGDWINTTWVPEGGLEEIWRSNNVFPTKELESVWEPYWYPSDSISRARRLASEIPDYELPPFISGGGSRTDDFKNYYTQSIAVSTFEGGNFWIEGVPLIEHVVDNTVKVTAIYVNGSWIDATGRVEVVERSFVAASDPIVQIQTGFFGYNVENTSIPAGHIHGNYVYEFDNIWEPYHSRLILLEGSEDIGNSWRPDGLLKDRELTFFTELYYYVADNVENGVRVYTASVKAELMTIQLEGTDGLYQYNILLSDDQMFIADISGIELFIVEEEPV